MGVFLYNNLIIMTTLSAVTLLFIIMDPFGNMVIFNNLLSNYSTKRRIVILVRETLIAYAILLVFLFFGARILTHLQISPSALSIGGGVVLFLVALGMVFPHRNNIQNSDGEDDEPFIVPIAIPFLAGPSLIAALLLLVSQSPERMADWFIAVTVTTALTMFILSLSPLLLKLLKRKGTRAVERLMGLLLIIISIQMLLNGIKNYLQSLS